MKAVFKYHCLGNGRESTGCMCDFTVPVVKKGDHLVSLYSPELLNAQSELTGAVTTP